MVGGGSFGCFQTDNTFEVSDFHVCTSSFYWVGGRFGLSDNSASGKLELERLGLRKALGAGAGSEIRSLGSLRLVYLVYYSPTLQARREGRALGGLSVQKRKMSFYLFGWSFPYKGLKNPNGKSWMKFQIITLKFIY